VGVTWRGAKRVANDHSRWKKLVTKNPVEWEELSLSLMMRISTCIHVRATRATLGKLFTHMCLCSPSSINWYRCKLGAKQALDATHKRRVRGLAALAGVWLKAIETEISTALWALVARGGL